jgi:predicted dehydrogenase
VINTAMELTRRQGRVVIVGYVKLDIHPKNFLYREIDLRYSRAYGPGSYDRGYEKGRVDYPYGYVRWTEERNLAEVIRLLGSGAVDFAPLVGGVFPLERAQEAFDAIAAGTLGGVAALLDHDGARPPDRRRTLPVRPHSRPAGKVGIGVIGIGNHVLGKHLPTLRRLRGVDLRGLASATGRNATVVAEKLGATVVTTDVAELLADPEVDGVLVCSSQPEHYGHLRQAIMGRKAVFVEKPLVTRLDHFREIAALMDREPVLLTLGLNRRYSPLLGRLRELLPGPVDAVEYLVAQPFVPPDHWTLDPVDGAGRLITEGEHFLDICHLLVGRPPLAVTARPLGRRPDDVRTLCNFAVTVHYDGAVANVVFDECGGAGFPRERITVSAKGMVAVLDDFARLTVHARRRQVIGRGVQKQMGHAEALTAFVDALLGRPSPMLTWEEARRATLSMFAAQESILRGESVDLRDFAAPAPG